MRVAELYAQRQRQDLTMVEAAEIPGLMECTFRRWSVRCQVDGAEAFDHRCEYQSANRRAAKELRSVVLATAMQLPASTYTFLKADNLFRESPHQA